MADDREQELKRLEKELLADEVIEDDDLLSDLPIELFDAPSQVWDEDEETERNDAVAEKEEMSVDAIIDDFLAEETDLSVDDIINETLNEAELPLEADTHDGESMSNGKKKATKKTKADQKREDRWLITLMAIASFLCVGIIAVLIYWLEVFLK